MKQTSENRGTSEQVVTDIRRATRKQYSAEEKIRIVLDGLRGEYSIAELCRRVLPSSSAVIFERRVPIFVTSSAMV